VQRDALVYLDDIIESCERVERYVEGVTRETFIADQKTIDAVIRNLEVIGEAVKKVPSAIRARMPEIDWPRIAGTRDVLIHGYFEVNLDIVWDIITQELAPLATAIERFLKTT
jgi:uncharacterized protein with HEPN domain